MLMHGKIFLRNEKTAWENKKMLDSVGRVCYTVITSKRVYFFVQKSGRTASRPSLSEENIFGKTMSVLPF